MTSKWSSSDTWSSFLRAMGLPADCSISAAFCPVSCPTNDSNLETLSLKVLFSLSGSSALCRFGATHEIPRRRHRTHSLAELGPYVQRIFRRLPVDNQRCVTEGLSERSEVGSFESGGLQLTLGASAMRITRPRRRDWAGVDMRHILCSENNGLSVSIP
jgi:hypothetical protein